MHRLIRLTACILFLALLATACAPADEPAASQEPSAATNALTAAPTPEPSPQAPFDIPEPGTLALGLAAPITSGDPHRGDSALITGIIEGLMRLTDGVYAPGVAESFETADYQTWTFTLRSGAVWSDGTPVTAEDFVYSWNLAGERAVSIDALKAVPMLDGIKAEAIDAVTLAVTLADPCPWFLQYAASAALAPIHKALYEANPDTYGASPETTGCNGPFFIESMSGDTIALARNEAYWNKEKISAEKVLLQIAWDEADLIAGVELGALHAAVLSKVRDSDADIRYFPGSSVACLFMNRMRVNANGEMINEEITGMLSNANLRMALTYAIDREAFANATNGRFAAAEFLTSGAVNTNNAMKQTYEALRDSQIVTVRMNRTADAEKAKTYFAAFLEEMHYSDVDALPEFPLAAADDADSKAVAELIAKQVLEAIGVKLIPEYMSSEQLRAAAESGNYDLMIYPVEAAYNDPMAVLELFGAADAFKGAWISTDPSRCGYYTSVLEQSNLEPDADVRALQLLQAEGIALTHAPALPLYIPQNSLLAADDSINISLSWQGGYDYISVNPGK